jgi:EmrB/QacA subfamily drug resistance transporter
LINRLTVKKNKLFFYMENESKTTKNSILVITSLASFLTPFMISALTLALPIIGKEFNMNTILLSWLPSAYLLAAAVFLVPLGRIADIYGLKKIFLIGIIVYTAASFLTAISFSIFSLIVFRILQGIGAAMISGTSTAIITSVFPAGEKGRALGINIATVYAGLSFGPFIGGFLTQHLGWRSIFWLNLILGIITIILTQWKLKGEWAEAKKEKFDFVGSVIFGIILVAVMFGLIILPTKNGIILILLGILTLGVFWQWEVKSKDPLFNLELFQKNPGFTFSNLAALINYSATNAISFLLSLYLQYIKGLSPQFAGLILVSQPIMQSIFSPLAGRLSDRIEPRVVASIGMALTVVGLLIFAFISSYTSLYIIIFDLILLGIGFAFFSSPNVNAIMKSVDMKFYGIASATLATMRMIGQMLSLGIVMLIFSLIIGRVQISPQYFSVFIKSTKILFLIFAILCFAGIWASLARGKIHNNQLTTRKI